MFKLKIKSSIGLTAATLMLTTLGCATTHTAKPIACDGWNSTSELEVLDTDQLSNEIKDETALTAVPQLESVPLGNYPQVPWPCRPSLANAEIQPVQWRSNPKSSRQGYESKAAPAQISTQRVFKQSSPKVTIVKEHYSETPPKQLDAGRCLPLLEEWKQEYEAKSARVEGQINTLTQTHSHTTKTLNNLQMSMAKSVEEIERLKRETEYYRKEVSRLELLMDQQHSEDLVLLDALSNQLGSIISQSKSETR